MDRECERRSGLAVGVGQEIILDKSNDKRSRVCVCRLRSRLYVPQSHLTGE